MKGKYNKIAMDKVKITNEIQNYYAELFKSVIIPDVDHKAT